MWKQYVYTKWYAHLSLFISYIADSHNGMQSMKNYRIVVGKERK